FINLQGQAFVQTLFSHWDFAPGDPLDADVTIIPLIPSEQNALARELLLKTRRRKGLSESVAAGKYFDEKMMSELQRQGLDISSFV
ncbi:MAG: putative U5 small nuclear ribonucleoprotein, partial [Streblomastix strix]